MNTVHLNGHHRRVIDAIFRHPAAHNLEWHDVSALLKHVGTVTEKPNGDLDVDFGARHATLAKPRDKDVGAQEIRQLQTLLSALGLEAGNDDRPAPPGESHGPRFIAVIDHHAARLFQLDDEDDAIGAPLVLEPDDPHGFLRHLEHRKEADYEGERVPEDHDYYERIAAALKTASDIVVVSRGTGKSNAGEFFVAYLQSHHAALADRVVGPINLDLSHLTDGEIVAAGREKLRSPVSLQ